MAAYSFHHSTGTEECRKTSFPISIDGQSEVNDGMRPTPSTLIGNSVEAKSSRASRISSGVLAPLTRSVNLLRRGVGGLLAGNTWEAIARSTPDMGDAELVSFLLWRDIRKNADRTDAPRNQRGPGSVRPDLWPGAAGACQTWAVRRAMVSLARPPRQRSRF